MARQTSLKEFQEALAQRLREAARAEPDSRLGFESAAQRYLIKLDESGEVLPLPEVSAVPLTRPWFLGLANVRGKLVSVIDFAAFMGGPPTPRSSESRLVLFSERFDAHCGLLVARMLGLKNMRSLELRAAPAAGTHAAPWLGGVYTENDAGEGRQAAQDWRELDLGALAAHEEFLQAGL
jgi:twitching motility protein PilI